MKNILSAIGSVFSFDWIETYFLKKVSTGTSASAIGAILAIIAKYGLQNYGIGLDADHKILQVSIDSLLSGVVLAVFNNFKHASDPKP